MKTANALKLILFLVVIFNAIIRCTHENPPTTPTQKDNDIIETVPDTIPPAIPAIPSLSKIRRGEFIISWDDNIDEDLAGYKLFRTDSEDSLENYDIIYDSTFSEYHNKGLNVYTNYFYSIAAYDTAGNVSSFSVVASGIPDSSFYHNDPNYPTVIHSLSSSQISALQKEFNSLNNHQIYCDIDNFGFIDAGGYPPTHPDTVFTDDDAPAMNRIAKSTLLKNFKFTGVSDTSSMQVKDSYWHGQGGLWRIRYENQVYEEIEVIRTVIFVWLDGAGVYRMSGNWYKDIYIPSNDYYDPESAQNTLIGKKLYYYEWGGIRKEIIISRDNLQEPIIKFIVPGVGVNTIDFSITWRISITMWNTVSWYIYVDTMTGNVKYIDQLFDTQ